MIWTFIALFKLLFVRIITGNGADYIVVTVNTSIQRSHCVGALINCCLVITSCRCTAVYQFKFGAMSKYEVSGLHVVAAKVKPGNLEIRDSFPHPGCHPSSFNADVYGNDIGAFRLVEELPVGNASKVKPMKGPVEEIDEEAYYKTYQKVIGKSCKVYHWDTSFIPTAPEVSVTILKEEECTKKLCNDPKNPKACVNFNKSLVEEGWGCATVPPLPYSKECLPFYGSPIICEGIGVGIVSNLCLNQTLLYTRIDSNIRFFNKMMELRATNLYPSLFSLCCIFITWSY